MPTVPYSFTQRSISVMQFFGETRAALRQHRNTDEVLREQRADAVDQLVAGAGPGFAGACIAKVVTHAGGAWGEDGQVGAALALHFELAALDRLADLVVRHSRARRRRLAGLARLDLLVAPSFVLTRGGGVVAVAINDHGNLPTSALCFVISPSAPVRSKVSTAVPGWSTPRALRRADSLYNLLRL